ncbi:DUF4292 domain-containing protein [Labilibaculum antarcticum]|jgi:hypothetical protein|uniref:DUF4292 domain-containing protein n=1 Tax=Labilibaculum antarcticum TaxID=1717717 RepID=A0A1Y1CJK4_9BACT|nr:DUF4292 domain-containing protein [Labilibaculum antarcticum]BAX80162.1 hypothetical protein ALGA_1788 [Labilibaculum antarcticum]
MSNRIYLKTTLRVLVIIIALFQFSCKSFYKLGVEKAKTMSDNKLYSGLIDSSLNYQTLYVKRFAANFSVDGISKSFKGSIKIEKDSIIWIDISATVGIPVARILITPDSVKMIDRLKKTYLIDGFDFFSEKLNLDLDFDSFQSILTNSIFKLDNEEKEKAFIRSFNGKIIGNKYVFISEKARKIDRKLKKDKLDKLDKYNYQRIDIEPLLMRITDIFVKEFDTSREISIKYRDFTVFQNRKFPQRLNFEVKDPKHLLSCNIKFNKITFDEKLRFSFTIPDKYDRIYP